MDTSHMVCRITFWGECCNSNCGDVLWQRMHAVLYHAVQEDRSRKPSQLCLWGITAPDLWKSIRVISLEAAAFKHPMHYLSRIQERATAKGYLFLVFYNVAVWMYADHRIRRFLGMQYHEGIGLFSCKVHGDFYTAL